MRKIVSRINRSTCTYTSPNQIAGHAPCSLLYSVACGVLSHGAMWLTDFVQPAFVQQYTNEVASTSFVFAAVVMHIRPAVVAEQPLYL